jgi:anti-sigma factor RsiW
MRELLPERVAELLSPRDAERVDGHVAECEMCAFEVQVLRAARATLRGRATIDVTRISGAVAAATRAPASRVPQRQQQSWIGWRAAASIALVAVGATSIAVWNGTRGGSPGNEAVTRSSETTAVTALPGNGTVAQGVAPASGSALSSENPGSTVASVAPVAASGLTAAGGLSDLSDAELESLLGSIGSLDASGFDEPQEVIPAIGGSEGVQ